MKTELFGRTIDTDNITPFQKVLAGGLTALAILLAGGYFDLYPKWTNLQALEAEIAEQETEIQTKELQVKNLPELKKELKDIEDKLVLLRRKIPKEANIAPLLLDVEEITENKALYGNAAVLNEFRPRDIVNFNLPASLKDAEDSETAKQLKQLPVNVRLSRISYPDLIKLLQDYESYERTLGLDELSILPVEDQDDLYTPVNVSFTLKAFLLAGGS
ncbi:MAG: type 4a pilus biogenesis protein PilO [Candidatus Sericytochromatia bacterium]|nr:type 4a pilus biogenesis protein PilO [Candidatus Sericytochromatia bacterium]